MGLADDNHTTSIQQSGKVKINKMPKTNSTIPSVSSGQANGQSPRFNLSEVSLHPSPDRREVGISIWDFSVFKCAELFEVTN